MRCWPWPTAPSKPIWQVGADAGKLERDFRLPQAADANAAERISLALAPARRDGMLPVFPLGTEMTETEQELAASLTLLKSSGYADVVRILLAGIAQGVRGANEHAALERMGLPAPGSAREWAMRALVLGALRRG